MIEYLFNAIRAVAGQEIIIAAKITDDKGEAVTEDCALMLYLEDKEVIINGTYYYDAEIWQFTVAAEVTRGYSGRFWYCFKQGGSNLCFKEPIYLV